MRTQQVGNSINVWLSASDTYDWAHKPGATWPCSTVSGKRIWAQFCNGDLVDLKVNGRDEPLDGVEFGALIEDFLGSANPEKI